MRRWKQRRRSRTREERRMWPPAFAVSSGPVARRPPRETQRKPSSYRRSLALSRVTALPQYHPRRLGGNHAQPQPHLVRPETCQHASNPLGDASFPDEQCEGNDQERIGREAATEMKEEGGDPKCKQ